MKIRALFRFADTLTRGLLRNEGEPRIEIRFDLSRIPELQKDLNQRTERAALLLEAGAITRNMALQMAGLEPVDDGDVYLLPADVRVQPMRKNAQADKKSPSEDAS